MIGVTVDQFQIQKSMGKAVEGEWFLASNQYTGDTVEILAIDKTIVKQPGFREGFLEDASELIGIEHPNLVAIINVLDENGSLFLVQEHVEGQKLSDLLNKRGALPPEQVLPVLKGILKGIGICNSEGLVHRFLNPNNLVIGNDGEPRITGLGHVLPSAIEQHLPEKHKAYAAQYWSPERLRNPDTTDIRANVYAAGVILYEMLMGRPPYYGDYDHIVSAHQAGQFPKMHNIPEDLQQTTAKALSPMPEGRYQNTVEFYKAIDKLNLGRAMPLVPGSMSDSFDLAAATMDSALPSDGNSSVDFSLDLPSESEDEDISLGLPANSGSADLDHLDFGGGFDAEPEEKDDTDDTISDGKPAKRLSSAAQEISVEGDFDFDPNAGAVSDSEFTFGDAGGGFDFAEPDSGADKDGALDFAVGGDSASENAVDDFSFDAGAEQQTGEDLYTASPDFSFGENNGNVDFGLDTSGEDDDNFNQNDLSAGDEDFGLGNDDSGSGEDFGMGNDDGGSGEDFGMGNGDGGSGEDFGMGTSDADFGFGSSDAGSDVDFGFGSSDAGSGEDFSMGTSDAGSDADFGFGSNDDAAASDFGFGDDEEKKSHQDDMLLEPDATSTSASLDLNGDGFSFGDEPSSSAADSDLDFGSGDSQFGFDSNEPSKEEESDGGFDFGAGGSSQFSFDEPASGAAEDSGFDFDGGGSSQFSFDGAAGADQDQADDDQAGMGSSFNLDAEADASENNGGFDFGDGAGSQFSFDGSADSSADGQNAQFDFGAEAEGDAEFDFDGGSPAEQPVADEQGDGFNFDDGGGFDFNAEPEAKEPDGAFDFGNQAEESDASSAPSGSENDFDFGNDEDPFARDEVAPAADQDDPFADFAGEGDAAPDESPSQQITTDDGAFSFETDDASDPASANEAGLASSLSAAHSQIGEKTDIIQVKRVRKVDTKILFGTIALALIAAVGGFLFWRNHQAKQFRDTTLTEIRQMIDGENYNQAIGVIDGHLASGVSDDFQAALLREKDRANSMKDKINQQIASLLERAEEAEKANNLLSDGQTDAYAAYMNVLKLDSSKEEASVRSNQIREDFHKEAEDLLVDGKELQALEIYNSLARADRADLDARNKVRDLSTKLQKERSGSLQEAINNNIARRQYAQAVPYFSELANIAPNSDYVKDMRKLLGDNLMNMGNESLAKRKFDEAKRNYELAIEVDPDRSDARGKLANIEEEALRFQTNKTSDDLAAAVTKKDYSKMFELAISLNQLDPGNQMASGALDTVRAEVLRLVQLAEGKRQNGLYKEAAELYKQAYLVDQNPEAQALWQKYERWTPPENMAYVPPGEFKMGARRPKASAPVHSVFLSGFYVDLYEITNRQFKEFIDQNPEWHPDRVGPQFHDGNYLAHWVKGKPKREDMDRPVTHVSWFAANEYAKWKGNRLLTEAEWEKAARGRTTTNYWWGDYSDAKKAVYQFYPEKKPAEISNTDFSANAYGVFHILGNVHEWVQDSFSAEFYAATDGSRNPVNEIQSNLKVYRGGSFLSRGRDLEVHLRNANDPRTCAPDVGFRTSRTANIE